MEHIFSIIMFAMAAGIALYAALIAATGDPKLIIRHYAAKMPNPKAYARRFALILVIVAGAFAVAGLTGLWKPWAGGVTLIVLLIASLYLSTRLIKKVL